MINVGLLGSGRLGHVIAGAIAQGKVPECRLVGVLGRSKERLFPMEEQYGCRACQSPEELLALEPRYMVEAATPQALQEHAIPFLEAGCSVICLSMGALYDQKFYDAAARAARAGGSKLYLASGVLGGFDLAATLSMMGKLKGTLIKYKYPNDSGRCPPALMELPDQFEGSAREGYQLSPAHLNVAVAAALACGGLDQTRLRIEPITDEPSDSFGLDLEGEFAGAAVRIRQGGFGGPSQGTALAAWSAVALLKRLTSPITF